MKKVVLGLSLVALAPSCKKLPEGGNKGVLKLEEGVGRYTDDAQHKLEPEENVSKTDSIQKENKVDSASTTH